MLTFGQIKAYDIWARTQEQLYFVVRNLNQRHGVLLPAMGLENADNPHNVLIAYSDDPNDDLSNPSIVFADLEEINGDQFIRNREFLTRTKAH